MHPAIISTDYALSPLQQGMLAHHGGDRASGVDHVQLIFNLPEVLSPEAFRQAWEWVAARHTILRTTFAAPAPGETPRQRVEETIAVDFTWQDWRNLDAVTREQWWNQLLERDRAKGFDLATAPLWRVTVIQLAPELHRVLFSFHHLLIDARSLLVLLPELFDATAAFAGGRAPQAAPAVPYRRYIDWLETQDTNASAGYWRAKLAGFRTATPLPGAASTLQAAETAGPGDQSLRLSARQTMALQSFARSAGVTMNTLVQGAWAVLLSRCTGESDVLFGAVRACRHGSTDDAGSIVGPMINTVAVRVSLPDHRHVVDWLRDLRQQWVDLRAHEHVALGTVRGWSEVPAGAPLFDTIVSYQEPSWDVALVSRGGAWARRRLEVRNQVNHPLALDVAGGPELLLRISYDQTRFSRGAIERMLGHLSTILAGFVAQPLGALAELPMLTPGEKFQLLAGWNRTPGELPPARCLHELFAAQVARTPDALAVADPHTQLDYASLDRRATALAQHLRNLGVTSNTFVAVCVTPSVDLVVALLGALKAGCAYVPLDPAYPAERLAFMLSDAAVPVVITQRQLGGLFAATPTPVVFLEDAPALPDASAALDAGVTAADFAYLIYTSGSTGTPKGVPIRHRHVANLVAWHQRTYAVTPSDRATQLASPAFDACVWELWPYLTAGASIHIPDAEIRVSPSRLVHWLADYRITLCFLPTPLAEATMDESWPAPLALRAILTGGDRLRRWPGRRLPCSLVNHYGPTENTVVSTWAAVPAEPDGHAALPSIGRPLANTEAYVLDSHRRPVPIGVPGELYLGGAGLSDGYHRRSDLTAEKFVDHPFSRLPGDRLYRTGDLVRWREDGELEYLGRIDQQVKIRGHRIEPGEIEVLLNEQPAVRESLVLAVEDATGQAQLVAYVLPAAGPAAPDADTLAQALHRRLPAYMVPASFIVLDRWPLTPNGKVDRKALPRPETAAATPRKVALRPGLETTVAQVWSEVLGRADISAHDDFFALGGHSLRAAQVISRLNAALSATLSVRHLFEHSTVAGLAAAIEQTQAAETRSATTALAQ